MGKTKLNLDKIAKTGRNTTCSLCRGPVQVGTRRTIRLQVAMDGNKNVSTKTLASGHKKCVFAWFEKQKWPVGQVRGLGKAF